MKPHLTVLSRCVGPRDATVLVAKCSRTGAADDHMLMLTRTRLIVTAKNRLTRRLRLYLNLDLNHLSDVTWTAEPALGAIRLAATAVDGVREHFLIQVPDVTRVGELLDTVFGKRTLAAA